MSVLLSRVLDPEPVTTLDAYVAAGGGVGRATAGTLGPALTIEEVEAAGLRGRGGAGFPTGTKWRTVAGNASPTAAATVVVNAAEGEPGSYKDRELLARNPYRVLEGALIAAGAVGADHVIVAVKASFGATIATVRRAMAEVAAAGWSDGIQFDVAQRARGVLVRRGDRVARGRRGSPAVPARGAALPPRRGGDRRRGRVGRRCRDGRRRHGEPARHRRWPTTSRRWPTCPGSSPMGPPGSGRSAPRRHLARSSAPCPGRRSTPVWVRSPWARPCVP